MAKKSPSGRKPSGDAAVADVDGSVDLKVTTDDMTSTADTREVPVSKPKAKTTEDQTASSSVVLGDIRKAVAFANSVGGLEKALALVQILKVAKEVQ